MLQRAVQIRLILRVVKRAELNDLEVARVEVQDAADGDDVDACGNQDSYNQFARMHAIGEDGEPDAIECPQKKGDVEDGDGGEELALFSPENLHILRELLLPGSVPVQHDDRS